MELPIIDPSDPTIAQAFEQLAADEAQAIAPAQKPDSATPAPSKDAPVPEKEDSPTPEQPPKEGTPPTESPTKPPEQAQQPAKSKYAEDQERRDKSWKALNTEKEEVRNLRKQIESDREALKAERTKFDEERAQASQPKYKPEDYERFALQCQEQAEKLDAEGNYDEAAAKRVDSRRAIAYAKELRANPPAPPPDAKKQEDDFKAQQKEWWGKAGIDFPAVLKKDSPEAQALAALVKSEPAIYNDPKGMYYAARLVNAEVAAGRVPTMEKELGEAHAKIKDLEGKLQVPNDGIVSGAPRGEVPYEQRSADEQEADVERMARELDASGNWR